MMTKIKQNSKKSKEPGKAGAKDLASLEGAKHWHQNWLSSGLWMLGESGEDAKMFIENSNDTTNLEGT